MSKEIIESRPEVVDFKIAPLQPRRPFVRAQFRITFLREHQAIRGMRSSRCDIFATRNETFQRVFTNRFQRRETGFRFLLVDAVD